MKCSTCQHENRLRAKFCEECSAQLLNPCLKCGNPLSATDKFCSECGYPTLPPAVADLPLDSSGPTVRGAQKPASAKSGLEGERKWISVLFADIKGSMELIADRDPEEAQKLIDPVIDLMHEAVHRYGGFVSSVMGDGIMALFGAPIAQEDHAVRACYAAIKMHEAIAQSIDLSRWPHGLPILVRVGINSGETVVPTMGPDLHMDHSIIGQTAHLASRMEQMATPGTVLVTVETARLVKGYVETKPRGLAMVKGLSQPIEIYEVVEAGPERTRLQAAIGRGLTRFVGRDRELAELHGALERARNGRGQIVAIVGEPGVGKSRVVHEFVHSSHTEDCLLLETNSASYGHSTSYLPVIELLRNYYFKINNRDNTRSIQEKVSSKFQQLNPSLQDAIPPILDLLDALDPTHPFRSLDPLQHRQLTYQAVSRLLLSANRTQPVVAVFEDLHWNDSLTLGLLNEVVFNAEESHLLLVVSYRPEFRDEWKGRPNYRLLHVDPLEGHDLKELLDALAGSDASLTDLRTFALNRSGGNPFFFEEIVRSLVEIGVLQGTRGAYRLARPFSSTEVPPTVQAVLAARIDAMPASEKLLLQQAAVIGHNVPFVLLKEISGQSEDELRRLLSNLQTAEFLYPTQLFPDVEFTFKHSLTHDVAYAGLLRERRRDIHACIVDVMENLYAERMGEKVERLADHALRGQLWKKAVGYLRQAGAKAADREAYREAVVFFEQALLASGKLPDDQNKLGVEIDIRFDIRNVLQPLGDRQGIAKYLIEAEQLAERLGDECRMGWVQSYLAEQFWMLGRYRESVGAGERALAVAAKLADLPLHVVTNLPLGLAHHTRGDYRRAIDCFGWNAKHLTGAMARERFGMFVLPASFARSFIAWGRAELGDFVDAQADGVEALRVAEEAEHPFSCGYAHLGLGVIAMRRGNVDSALSAFEQALAAGAFADSPVGFAFVALHMGYALSLAGRLSEGIPILERSVEIAESRGFVARHALRLAYISEAYSLAGRGEAALEAGNRALQLARLHEERANEGYVLRVLAQIETERGRYGVAEGQFREALRLAMDLGMRPLEAHCRRGIGTILEGDGKLAEAAEQHAMASAGAASMGLRFWGTRLWTPMSDAKLT